MSKATRNPEDAQIDIVSASRYNVPMHHNNGNGSKNGKASPKRFVDYIGKKGVLLRADCLDLLANMREGSVDLVFVDPPFNLGKDYDAAQFSDDMETESYRIWCRTWISELTRVLKPGGAFFLYHWPKWLMEFGAWMNTLPALEYKAWIALKMKSGFPIRGRIHPAHYGLLYYVKHGGSPTFNIVRHKSPTCRHCGKLVRDYGGYRKKFERFEDEEGVPWVQISDFWEDTRPARQDKMRKNSTNELPLHVPERAILMASNPGDVVLDCFAGGGSTLHAAHSAKRLFIGGDFGDPAAALQRIATFIGSEETATPDKKILNCFSDSFRSTVINTALATNHRPIASVNKIEDVNESMDRFASKSRVLGF